jgi:SSS family solute:Na+ symporter
VFDFDEAVVNLGALDWLIVALYIGGMLFIGIWFARKSKGFDDYFMAGRSLTAPLLVGTLVSTFYGLDTLFGTSEVAFYEGISAFFAYSLPYTALYVVMAFLSPQFKKRFPENATMQDIAFQKYGNKAGTVVSVSAFLYSTNTMEMMGIGFLLHLVLGMPFWMGVMIGAAVVLIYTLTGGLWAVTLTDFVQFFIMLVIVGIGCIIAWYDLGGFSSIFEGLELFAGEDPSYYFSPGAGYLTTWTLIAYSVTSLAVLCDPAFFQRMFASAGPKEIKKAFAAGVPMWLSFDWAVTFLGISAAAAIGLGVIPEVEPNQALFAMLGQYLPVGLLGLAFVGILAAAMSTSDSYFLASGGVIGYDLYKVVRPKSTGAQRQRMVKIGILISAVLSISLAFVFERIMTVWVFQATIIITTALIPVYMGTFLKKKPKRIAGTLSATVGLVLAVGYYLWIMIFGFWNENAAVQMLKLPAMPLIDVPGVKSVNLWTEYGILIITPIVLVVFLVANWLGKEVEPDKAIETHEEVTL